MFTLLFISTLLSADNFDKFLDLALQSNQELKTAMLSLEQSEKKSQQMLQYKNPSLELELASFNPQVGSSELGSRVAISQPIRLWGLQSDTKSYTNAQTQLLRAKQNLTRSMFIYSVSMNYLNYIYEQKSLVLSIESLALAKKIFDITDAMYQAGKISRAEALQAKLTFSRQSSQVALQKYQQKKDYYTLLKYSNITQEFEIDSEYIFVLKEKKVQNPELQVLQKSTLSAQNQATLRSHKVEWMELVAEYENEPDQNIFRVGLSIPLAIFDTQSQAKDIALLELKKQNSFIDSKEKMLSFELKRLRSELDELEALKQSDKKLLQDEVALLAMFEEGYKIANINLLSLEYIKNSLIQTKENLLDIEHSKQKNIIKINYLQGSLND